jgi:hypothetical protein
MKLEDIKEIGWYIEDKNFNISYLDCITDLYCVKRTKEEFDKFFYQKLLLYTAEKFDFEVIKIEIDVCSFELFGEIE